ncbi:MAG: PfkB family carbohydrate kinase [Tannerella sp.]|nr:PfkB family carbohydrate kinase [Tannerella sp.]
MKKYDFCCIGHITLDKVVTPNETVYMPGGTSYYVSQAIRRLNHADYLLVTAVGESEVSVIDDLRTNGIEVINFPSRHSVCFENIYEKDMNNRKQKVSAKADHFTVEQLNDIEANIFHIGALLEDDFSLDTIQFLAGKGLVSVDSQGFLREVRDTQVHAIDWKEKLEAMKFIHFLKANEHEMYVLTGYNYEYEAAKKLYEWGVKEVLITLGSEGSVLYDGTYFYTIPAYQPKQIVDATGCGDTYMAGYLYQRVQGVGMEQAGHFAAALSTLKIERFGPAQATNDEVQQCMKTAEKRYKK